MKAPYAEVFVAKGTPRGDEVLLEIAGKTFQFPCLQALYLSGALLAAGLEVVASSELGVRPTGEAGVTVWEMFGEGCWVPAHRLTTVEALEKEVERVREQGTPYRLTIDLALDPLKVPEGATL